MVNLLNKLSQNTILVLSGTLGIFGIVYKTERTVIMTNKMLTLEREKFEFEKNKYNKLMESKYKDSTDLDQTVSISSLDEHTTLNTVEIPKIVNLDSKNNIISSPNELSLMDYFNELLNQYSNNVLFNTSLTMLSFSIVTLICLQGLVTNYLVKKHGDNYQDYLPTWLKIIWKINSNIINQTNSYFIFIIIYSQFMLLLLGFYLLIRVLINI